MGFFMQHNCKVKIFILFFYSFEVLWSWSYKYVQGDQTAKKRKTYIKLKFKIYMPIIWHWWMGLSSSLQAVMWLGYSIPSIYRVAFHNIHRLVHRYTEVYWGGCMMGLDGQATPKKRVKQTNRKISNAKSWQKTYKAAVCRCVPNWHIIWLE